ncbi:phage baseplate assembly protein V, partial [Apibacter muscae]
KLHMQLVPQKFSYIAYDAKQAKAHTVKSEAVSLSRRLVNPFQQYAMQASEDIYTKVPSSLYNHSLMEAGEYELKQAVKRQKQKRQNVFFMEAKTNKPDLRVGDTIKLKAWMPGHEIFKNGEVPLESYRILEIKHYQDVTEGYYNEVIAIPKDNEVPPYMDEDAFPACEEQSAIVTDNNDPEGMSRIRVQFPWQKAYGGQSPWIRSITPYAGSGKGMHVVPEIGEEVIVSFENGNAEKPVSLGAMFNGKGKSGHGGAGNYMKGLQTASGNKLLMNDQSGSVLLEDHGQTSMNFDGAGNSSLGTSTSHAITVGGTKEAPDGQAKLLMDNAGNITLKANTNITLEVGDNKISVNADGTITINGDKILSTAKTGFGVNGGEKVEISAANNHIAGTTKLDGGDVFVN